MFEALKQWRLKRRIHHTAIQSLAEHKGFAGKGWPATATMSSHDRTTLAHDVRTWLADQLPFTATPHGLSRYHIVLGYAAMQGQQRTYLGQDPFTPFERAEAPTVFDQVQRHLCTRNLSAYPSLTTIEVYLVSYGDLLKPIFDAA